MAGLKDAVLISEENLQAILLTIGIIEVTLAPNATWTRKINILGDVYLLKDVDLKVSVLDEVANSPTLGYWLPADAVASIGWKDSGDLIVINQHSTSLKFRITAKAIRSDMGLLIEE